MCLSWIGRGGVSHFLPPFIAALLLLLAPALNAGVKPIGKDTKPKGPADVRPSDSDRIAKAKYLPKTVVLRIKKDDPGHVEVMQSSERLTTDEETRKKVENGSFTRVAINEQGSGEVKELDEDLTTSSFGFFFPWQNGYYNSWYSPTLSFAGSNFPCRPYWGYSNANYLYAYASPSWGSPWASSWGSCANTCGQGCSNGCGCGGGFGTWDVWGNNSTWGGESAWNGGTGGGCGYGNGNWWY